MPARIKNGKGLILAEILLSVTVLTFSLYGAFAAIVIGAKEATSVKNRVSVRNALQAEMKPS